MLCFEVPGQIEAPDLVRRQELALTLLVGPIRLEGNVQVVAKREFKLGVEESVGADRGPRRRVVLVGVWLAREGEG